MVQRWQSAAACGRFRPWHILKTVKPPINFVVLCVLLLAGCGPKRPASVASSVKVCDLGGVMHQPLTKSDDQVTVLIFITNDCPISNAYAPTINGIVEAYKQQGVHFFLVHVDPNLELDAAQKHFVDYGYRCLVLLDPKHELVKAVGATITPEVAVIDKDHRLRYLGRIDDWYVDFGKKRVAPSKRDLRDALDAVMKGKVIANERTKAIGCPIPEA